MNLNQVDELERAILARAERLASEYRERAARSRDSLLRESAERLRLRETREEASAKALGERAFRQRVQSTELKMQTHLDRLRWNLVLDVERRLTERMERFMADQEVYDAWLQALIVEAATAMESSEICIAANAHDQRRLFMNWDAVVAALPADTEATLAPAPDAIDTLGGVLVTSADGRIRVDQTFEGRLQRLRARIQQTILERLLPNGLDASTPFSG
ncbi:V/A-type H+-transporting ATPase subunit E [Allochromatium warmingii]|uniref:V-type ATP synthase subunit E n=1 Tax=Allochromatium warmingii TaxID=61595 RepID=A0A1H3F7R4_ALLWA|nr:V/A-type H+-transporting ATPase subunit E [Allochromatium warmingii]